MSVIQQMKLGEVKMGGCLRAGVIMVQPDFNTKELMYFLCLGPQTGLHEFWDPRGHDYPQYDEMVFDWCQLATTGNFFCATYEAMTFAGCIPFCEPP